MKCHNCKNERDVNHFRPAMSACVFCEAEALYKEVDRIEHFINNNPPVGRPMRALCANCKTLCFWTNLRAKGNKDYCGTCFDGLNKVEQMEVKDLPALQDMFLDLFGDEAVPAQGTKIN